METSTLSIEEEFLRTRKLELLSSDGVAAPGAAPVAPRVLADAALLSSVGGTSLVPSARTVWYDPLLLSSPEIDLSSMKMPLVSCRGRYDLDENG